VRIIYQRDMDEGRSEFPKTPRGIFVMSRLAVEALSCGLGQVYFKEEGLEEEVFPAILPGWLGEKPL